jgi:hypothetical protein
MAQSELTVTRDGIPDPVRMVEYTAAMCGETLAGAAWLTRRDAESDDFCSKMALVCLDPMDRAPVRSTAG